jgi:zinc transporter ZupT
MVVLSISIFIHKIPVGFTLGFLFESSNKTLGDNMTRIVCALFVLTTPIGVIIGAVLAELSNLVLVII